MLQQIFNITNNPDLNKSKKFQRYRETKNERLNSKVKEHDTACFSAASQFLSRVNWQITNLNFEGTEEFIISFTTGEFLFNAKFRPYDLSSQNGIDLEVIRQLKEQKRMVVSTLIPFDILNSETHAALIDFDSISVLFTRLDYLTDEDEIKTISEGFYEDLVERLNDELGSLCSLIISFAEKLLSIELWHQIKSIINLTFNDKIIVRNVKIR